MADVKKINGYNVKDETARNGLLAKQDIMQFSTMPADADWGKIVQYIGATDANYTEGYFYKAIAGLSNTVAPTGVTATVTDGDRFTAFMKYIENLVGVVNFDGIDHITITIQLSNNVLYGYIQYYDANGRRAGIVSNYPLSDYEQNTGMTITGATENDLITADVVKVASWQQTNVQPGGSGGSYSAGTGISIANNTISIDSIVLRNTTANTNAVATAGSNGAGAGGLSIGPNSSATLDACAFGPNAIAGAQYSVQIGTGTNSLQGTLKVFNVQYTYNTTGQVTFNPYLIGIGDRTRGSVLMYLDDQKATWVKPERNVPEMSNVQAIQRLRPEQYVDNDFKAHNTELEFHVNMKPADVVKAANDLYVTVSRWKRNRRISVLYQGEDFNIRTRGKYSVMNDQRVKLDHKMYCWRYLDDESLDNENPNKWRFFYTESNYNSVAALVSDDPTVWLSCDSNLVSNYATCLNALTSAGGYSVSDMGNSQYIFRYADGDIDTYVHNGIASEMVDYIAQTTWHCREFYNKSDDEYLYLWAQDWTDGNSTVYGIVENGDFVWNQTTQHFSDLSSNGANVDAYIDIYDSETDRPDLDFKMFNTNQGSIGDFCDYLYGTTVLGNIGDTNINWIAYWFDYPIMPTLLSECYVMIPKNITGGVYRAGTRVKLKTLMKEGVVENYFDTTEDMKFILPWDTYYLWMRFLSWQKLCFYDITFQLGSWSLKNSLTYAASWSNGTDTVYSKHAFGRTRSKYRHANENSQVSEYIEFNLATPENVIHGTTSRSQPIHKRLVIANSYHGIKD